MACVDGEKIRYVFIGFLTCLFGLTAQAKYGGGSGTAGDPYLISTGEQMNAIGANPGDWDKHFKLMEDIDLSAYTGEQFNIIGIDSTNAFSGVFDGNGKKIYNFSYTTATDQTNVALFGCVGGTGEVIRHLSLIAPHIEVSSARVERVGSLVGLLWGGPGRPKIIDCHVEGCSVSGGNANTGVGGLAGGAMNRFTIANCSVTGTVSSLKKVGGLVGNLQTGSMVNCYAVVSVSGDNRIGGLVGSIEGGSVTATVTNCYASGSVSGNDRVGGLMGENGSLGSHNVSTTKCYSTAQVAGTTQVGGLLGKNNGMVSNCFWDTQTSGVGNMCGFQSPYGSGSDDACGKSTAEMQAESTFTSAGWDFAGTWDICEGTNYPLLIWQIPVGDIRCPDGVNFIDYSFFLAQWLNDNCNMSNYYCEGSDLDLSGIVDSADLRILADNWLAGMQP